MDDVKFTHSHSNSPLPEAGNDPGDPLRPEIEEENSTPNPPITDPYQDMEVTEEKTGMPDQDDLQEAGLSDNDSGLSDLDDDQFKDFDAADLDIEERPAQIIDDTNVNLIGVHKRKRTEADGELPKKKKKRADKPRRKKNRGDDEVSANEDSGARKRRTRKEGKPRDHATVDEEDDAHLPEDERE